MGFGIKIFALNRWILIGFKEDVPNERRRTGSYASKRKQTSKLEPGIYCDINDNHSQQANLLHHGPDVGAILSDL